MLLNKKKKCIFTQTYIQNTSSKLIITETNKLLTKKKNWKSEEKKNTNILIHSMRKSECKEEEGEKKYTQVHNNHKH